MTRELTSAELRTVNGRSVRRRLWGLVRLSKIFVYQHYYGWALAWLLLSPAASHRRGSTAAMLLFLLGSIGIVTCACTADDIVGFRNGSDAINYRADERKRKIQSKPLLSGAVTEREAILFAACAGAVAVIAGTGAFWSLGWQAPAAAYVIYVLGGAFSVQYSAGLRVSYHRGGAETLLLLATASGLLAPYLAVERHWSSSAVIEALLLGLWLVMVSSYSNVNDMTGDRHAGRRTLAVTSTPGFFMTVMVLFYLVSLTLICVLALDTRWPWWTLLTMVPASAVHGVQLYIGPGRGDWLKARRLGLHAYDLGFAGIVIPTLFILLS